MERKQYDEVCVDKDASSIYGIEHLLRLFGNMVKRND